MDPILRIVFYLFKKKGISNNDETYKSFFENGISFPQFVAIAFNIDSIPNIIKNPTTISHKNNNNSIALQYLCENNPTIAKNSPNFNNDEERTKLLSLILTNQCFEIDGQEILNKCNLVAQSLGITFDKISELFSAKCLISLLNALTDGRVPINTETNDFNELILKNFNLANAPLVIDKTSLDGQNKDIFLIQILIIFDFFSDKINQFTSSTKKHKTRKGTNESKNESEAHKNKSKKKHKHKKDHFKSNSNELNSESQNKELLKTINAIGPYHNFKNILQTIKPSKISKFVAKLLKLDENAKEEMNQYSEVKDINAVIDYLQTRNPIFKTLILNFKNPDFIESSAVLLYKRILNIFFLKKSKKEMFERCTSILFYRGLRESFDEFQVLTDINTYYHLLHFAYNRNIHFPSEFDKNKMQLYFTETKIPKIIDNDFLKSCLPSVNLPDEIYYQIQFIYNYIDSQTNGISVIEILVQFMNKINKIILPPFKQINQSLTSIPAHRIHHTEEEKEISNKKCLLNKAQTFSMRYNHNKKSELKIDHANSFWNKKQKDDHYIFENGILFDQSIYNERKKEISLEWEDEMKLKKMPDKLKTDIDIDIDKIRKNSLNNKNKLYKIFYYDQRKDKWIFEAEYFLQMTKEKSINEKNLKIPIITFLASNEDDIITLCSQFTTGSYPNIFNDDNQIYVYGLCDQSLSMKKNTVKPIFLLFHVPKSSEKTPNIKKIVYQIYSFLSFVSDVRITVLDKDHYKDQIEFIQNITNSIKSFSNEKKVINSSECELHAFSSLNSEDDGNDEEETINDELNDDDDIDILMNYQINYSNQKNQPIIFLIKSKSIQSSDSELKQGKLIQNLKKEFVNESCDFLYININDFSTYEPFLDSINKFSFGNEISVFQDIVKKFTFIKSFQLSSFYLDIRNQTQWKEILENTIRNRFSELQMSCENQFSSLSAYAKILLEVSSIAPIFDFDFSNECNLIINKIKEEEVSDKQIIDELSISSDEHLKYIKNLIEEKVFLSLEERANVRLSHIQFLKDEYYSIIHFFSPDTICNMIYQQYINVLDEQIINDINDIDNQIFYMIDDKKNYTIQNEDVNYRRMNYVVKKHDVVDINYDFLIKE